MARVDSCSHREFEALVEDVAQRREDAPFAVLGCFGGTGGDDQLRPVRRDVAGEHAGTVGGGSGCCGIDDGGELVDGPLGPTRVERLVDVEHLEERDAHEAVLGVEVIGVDSCPDRRWNERIEVDVGDRRCGFDRAVRRELAGEEPLCLRLSDATRREVRRGLWADQHVPGVGSGLHRGDGRGGRAHEHQLTLVRPGDGELEVAAVHAL